MKPGYAKRPPMKKGAAMEAEDCDAEDEDMETPTKSDASKKSRRAVFIQKMFKNAKKNK